MPDTDTIGAGLASREDSRAQNTLDRVFDVPRLHRSLFCGYRHEPDNHADDKADHSSEQNDVHHRNLRSKCRLIDRVFVDDELQDGFPRHEHG